MKTMLYEQPGIRRRLRAVAYRFASGSQELHQFEEEGTEFIWQAEERAPGQTRSWYLRRWKSHLRDFVMSGRSVDARKREQRVLHMDDPDLNQSSKAEVERSLVAREDTFAEVSARDLLELLAHRLCWPEDLILKWLTEGWGMRAIGMGLEISAAAVYGHVLEIRAIARGLGIEG